MNPALQTVRKPVILPAAIVNNASFTAQEIDSAGYAYALFEFMLGATDIAMTALKVTETDVSGSGYSDVTGAVFGTSNNDTGSASTLPSATDDNKIFGIGIDLRGRKRYFKPTATMGNGSSGGFLVGWVTLYLPEDAPRTALESGFSQRLLAG